MIPQGLPYDIFISNGQVSDAALLNFPGRPSASLEHEKVSRQLEGQTILVTGAAGSIGSEICRQVARFRPAALIGYDIAESPLVQLGLEMDRNFPETNFRVEIGSVQHAVRLQEVFQRYRPSVVYHAAAYKHVPLMESHLFEAVENNVLGTLNVVETSQMFGVTAFVMISSDKAVRPASLMGATKRLSELVVRSLCPDGQVYVSVRLGNVLGSNGSVTKIFSEQIARGGPITITHPDMERFFMTIPEASELILQASAMGKDSEIFVVDMGEPVNIVDLARNLICLSGLRPDEDIRIVYTGAHAGEKLSEELSEGACTLRPTIHDRIKVLVDSVVPRAEMHECLARLRTLCTERKRAELLSELMHAVPEYRPSSKLLCGVHSDVDALMAAAETA